MTASPNQMISFHHQFVAFRQSMAFLNKSMAPLAESIDHLPKSLRKRHGICLTGTQMKWAGHQLVLEGSHLIWGGNPWFWRGMALISEGELLTLKGINTFIWIWHEVDRNRKRANWILKGSALTWGEYWLIGEGIPLTFTKSSNELKSDALIFKRQQCVLIRFRNETNWSLTRTMWFGEQIKWFGEDMKWFWKRTHWLGVIIKFREDNNWFW